MRRNSRFIQTVWWLLLVLCFAPAGCSRTWYRNQADEEVAETLAEKGGYLDNGLADPRPESRMAYHSDPDQPPMPRDDPASHAFMHEVDGHSGFGGWHSAGSEASVDAGTWFDSLPRAEDGTVVLSLGDAVKVARTNSRGYQTKTFISPRWMSLSSGFGLIISLPPAMLPVLTSRAAIGPLDQAAVNWQRRPAAPFEN